MPEESPQLDHVVLAGDGLALRPWLPSDAAALLRIAEDRLIGQWNTIQVADLAQARDWIDKRRDWTGHATWAVCEAPSGDIVGYVSLFHLDIPNACGELGYWVAPEARGRSIAACAVLAVRDYATSQLALERLELYHAVENEASCRVALKAGFSHEGTLRKSYRYADGVLHDEHLHAWVS
jgi:RimJ/RimL family protein N-acetyltransferase